jgi:hypothetical protein
MGTGSIASGNRIKRLFAVLAQHLVRAAALLQPSTSIHDQPVIAMATAVR